jgi:hypothetical protein
MYIVLEKTLGKHHPLWPNTTFFQIKNMQTDRVGLGLYTSRERAEKIIEEKK